ncbi:DNA methyltransferase [Novosphingobium sp. Chol11]|uniref:DNA methyltransferase n=1 Tax=Novosphingobium sp. Chol11 TaxID=1385763 RepID=UPI001596D9BA|nr:DNA methyltransferase [Novosphingobium sp. Chol11]
MDVSHGGDIVLDPFTGSGTAIIAPERTGRRAYGIELEPRFVDSAIRRWETLTGHEAIHLESGLSFADVATERAKSDAEE